MITHSQKLFLGGTGWSLSGWFPYFWQLRKSNEAAALSAAEILDMPTSIPCSVQSVLKENNLIPDWNIGLNQRLCEWVENRHWIFRRDIDMPEGDFDLLCEGLDYNGWILWDGTILDTFKGSNHPHRFQLPAQPGRHTISIVFDLPPRWLGQFGDTRKMSIDKPRYYYTWDWMPRIVQTGITGNIWLIPRTMPEIRITSFNTTQNSFKIRAQLLNATDADTVTLNLTADDGTMVFNKILSKFEIEKGFTCTDLHTTPWQPNGHGKAVLYTMVLKATNGAELSFKVGFRTIRRLPCQDAPTGADNWLFEINGQTLFIQGVNWTPLLPNYADTREEDYRRLVSDYKKMGINMLRVWGGASREKQIFYDLCDKNGIMVWQEFPLCSSGVCNIPPDNREDLDRLALSAENYLDELICHPCLTVWSGGNELFYSDTPAGRPCTGEEPALRLIANILKQRDADRIFVPTSASGPTEYCNMEDNNKGLHHDTHGPWSAEPYPLSKNWQQYWNADDSLFRSEFGAPGAENIETLRKYAGNEPLMPIQPSTPIWHLPYNWWLETEAFNNEFGRQPHSPEEFVAWSQARQAEALTIAITCAKQRFPKCGGVIIWMGHDSFPCPTNTSLIDFDGKWKPSAYAVQAIFCAN